MPNVFPSKLVGERVTLVFEFLDQMEWGETLASAECEISVLTGTDPAPELLVYRPPAIQGSQVFQRISDGVPGVIYTVTIYVTGSSGNIYESSGNLAILPSPVLIPPFIATFYTTTVYPLSDTLPSWFGFDALPGELRTLVKDTTMELPIQWGMSALSGHLSGGFISTAPQPLVGSFSVSMIGGELRALLKTTAPQPLVDSFSMDCRPGEMKTTLVTNTYPETVQFSVSAISGTLA